MRYFQQKVEIHWQELVNEMFLASELEKKKKARRSFTIYQFHVFSYLVHSVFFSKILN